VDPVPDQSLLKTFASARNRTQSSGSIGRKYDHWTTEAVRPKNEGEEEEEEEKKRICEK
jgi:hypothetical protein